MNSKPAIWAVAPWFGAKRQMANDIIAEFGPHRAYWEPFCGSLAILLAKEVTTHETVSDLHGGLITFARTLSNVDYCEALYAKLARTLCTEQQFHDSVLWLEENGYDSNRPSEFSYHFFIASWLGRNGVAGTLTSNRKFCLRYTALGGTQAVRFMNAVNSIPAWHERLRRVSIIRQCAFKQLERIDDSKETVIYCDPPYIDAGNQYLHRFKDDIPVAGCPCGGPHDHETLAELLRRFKHSRVIVSYYSHPRLDQLYKGWTKCEFEVTKNMAVSGKKPGKSELVKANELLLINGPSIAEEASDDEAEPDDIVLFDEETQTKEK